MDLYVNNEIKKGELYKVKVYPKLPKTEFGIISEKIFTVFC